MILKAFSKGLYSSWYYYAPDRLLLDAGEGVSLFLGNEVFAIERVVLSHGHMDHVSGLAQLISVRQSAMGDKEKPLIIHYPAGDRSIEILRDALLEMVSSFVRYPLEWEEIRPGDTIALKKKRFLRAYPQQHRAPNPLAYVVHEPRRQLKAEHHGKPGRELAALPDEEKFDAYEGKLFVFSGDGMPLPAEVCRGAELMVHDCTFMDAADRKRPDHSAVQEVFDLAAEAEVKRVILTHLSPRYSARDVRRALDAAEDHGLEYDWVRHNRVNRF